MAALIILTTRDRALELIAAVAGSQRHAADIPRRQHEQRHTIGARHDAAKGEAKRDRSGAGPEFRRSDGLGDSHARQKGQIV